MKHICDGCHKLKADSSRVVCYDCWLERLKELGVTTQTSAPFYRPAAGPLSYLPPEPDGIAKQAEREAVVDSPGMAIYPLSGEDAIRLHGMGIAP